MTTLNMGLAFALVGVGWLTTGGLLRRSLRSRPDPTEAGADHLAEKTAPWRPAPDNRRTDKLTGVMQEGRV